MTLVVALKTREGIVLAADSRGTIGDPSGLTAINDTQIKLHKLGNCGVGVAGSSEMAAVLLDDLQKKGDINFPDIDRAVDKIVPQSRENFDRWFGSIPPAQRPVVLLTLVGYRSIVGAASLPMIYMLNSPTNFAPQLMADQCLSGIPQYAVYLFHRYYAPSISLERGKALAEYLISETASQDPKVGGPVRMAEITPTQGYRGLTKDEVDALTQANQKLNAQLREFFVSEVT